MVFCYSHLKGLRYNLIFHCLASGSIFFPNPEKLQKSYFYYSFITLFPKETNLIQAFSSPSDNYWLTKPMLSVQDFYFCLTQLQGTSVHYLMKVALATLAYEFLNLWFNAIKVSYLITISPLYAVHSFIGTQTGRDCSFIIFGKQLACFCQFSL